jgi:hypothetical protein
VFGALLVNFGSFTFLCAVACRGWKNGKVPKCAVGREGKNALCFHNISICAPKRVSDNDLHASDGRDTEALYCKPITNL